MKVLQAAAVDWLAEFHVDLVASRAEDRPVLWLRDLEPVAEKTARPAGTEKTPRRISVRL